MSRSYEHTPVCKPGGKAKYAKRLANKRTRYSMKDNRGDAYVGKSNHYRRESESWDIWDYRLWGGLGGIEETAPNTDKDFWQKFYRRK